MTVNLNSQAFLDQTQNDFAKKQMAELYMQVYQYAAEDFPSHPDLLRYIQELTRWMMSVDERLARQMEIISKHTHNIPPHTHGVIKHSITSPTSLVTLIPTENRIIKWSPIDYPIFVNTTLTTPNLVGNKITINSSSEGSAIPTIRRQLPIPLTLVPKLSPVLQDSLTGGVV